MYAWACPHIGWVRHGLRGCVVPLNAVQASYHAALTTWGHSGDPPRTRIPLRPTHPFSSSAFADTEVVIELLIQFSLLGIEFRLASLFGLVCGGARQEPRCPRLHLYYRRIVQYGSSRIDQRIGKNLAPTPNQRSAYTYSDGRAHAIVPFFTGLRARLVECERAPARKPDASTFMEPTSESLSRLSVTLCYLVSCAQSVALCSIPR